MKFESTAQMYMGRWVMATGISMLKIVPGHEKAIYYQLKGNEAVLDVYHIFGEFDFILILYANGLDGLNKLLDGIREIRGVATARTVLVGWDRDMPGLNPVEVSVCLWRCLICGQE